MAMAAKIVLMAFLLGMVDAATLPKGQPSCLCLGDTSRYGIKKFACDPATYPWHTGGVCVNVTGAPVPGPYPADYGTSCKKHLEPGTSDCYDIDAKPPTEKAADAQKGWCNDPWCYVDACACDASDATFSFWFAPIKIPYSYATCGASDKFTNTMEGGLDKLGKADCAGQKVDYTGPTGVDADTSGDSATGTTAAPGGTTGEQSHAQMASFAMPILLIALWTHMFVRCE